MTTITGIMEWVLELSLIHIYLILSRLGVIILSGIILGVISIIGTMLIITPQYESTTKIMVLNKQDSNTLTSADMQTSTQLTKDYAELIKSRTVPVSYTHLDVYKRQDKDTALLIKREVSDGVIAPGYTEEALEVLKQKKKGNYNVIQIDPEYVPAPLEHKQVFGVTFEQGRQELAIDDELISNCLLYTSRCV